MIETIVHKDGTLRRHVLADDLAKGYRTECGHVLKKKKWEKKEITQAQFDNIECEVCTACIMALHREDDEKAK